MGMTFFNKHYNKDKREILVDETMGRLNSELIQVIDKYTFLLWNGEVYQVLIRLAETYRNRVLRGESSGDKKNNRESDKSASERYKVLEKEFDKQSGKDVYRELESTRRSKTEE